MRLGHVSHLGGSGEEERKDRRDCHNKPDPDEEADVLLLDISGEGALQRLSPPI